MKVKVRAASTIANVPDVLTQVRMLNGDLKIQNPTKDGWKIRSIKLMEILDSGNWKSIVDKKEGVLKP